MKIRHLLIILIIFSNIVNAQIPNKLSTQDKIYGLSKFWNEVNYNFVYLYKVDKNIWENTYKEAITNVINSKNDYEYFRELLKVSAILKDGHTKVNIPNNLYNVMSFSDFGDYRINTAYISGKYYIIDINKSKESEIPLGSEILKVNNLTTNEYQAKFVAPFISASSPHVLKNKAGIELLYGLDGDNYLIEIKTPKGELKILNLTHKKSTDSEMVLSSIPKNQPNNFKWIDKNIAYFSIKSFDNSSIVKEFESNLNELIKAKKIIIDIRNNGGGSSQNSLNIAKYFIENDTIYGPRNFSRKIIPTDRGIGSFLTEQDTINGKQSWGLSKEHATAYFKEYADFKFHEYDNKPIITKTNIKIKVPIVILTNSGTASASEDFLIYLYNQKNITRIGDFTNGSTGQPLQVILPGYTTAWICTKKVTLPNGEEFMGKGISPHIKVERTLKDVLMSDTNDSQLSEAIKYLNKI